MTAYGYIRKSVVHDPTRMLSPETQEAAIRALATAHGDEDVVILSDLDVSGRKERTHRPGWDEVLSAIEDGRATAVYAYSLSRFARSTSQLLDFFNLCRERSIPVRMHRDQIDTSTAMGRMVLTILASIVTMEADIASERVKDAFAAKRRKDPTWAGPGNVEYGMVDGEDVPAVVEAFREAGSFDGAARLLNERGVQTRLRDAIWHGTTVAAIVRRAAPDEVGPATSRGAAAGKRAYRLARLLACSVCGTFLTPSRGRFGEIRYYCHRARFTPHPRGWVYEPKLLPLIAREVEHAAVQIKRLQKGSIEDEARMVELGHERERVKAMFRKGHMEEAEYDTAMAELADAEARLSTRRAIKRIAIPPDVEQGTPEAVNRYVRRLFDRVVVDMSVPGRKGPSKWVPALDFQWRDPSMRAESIEEPAA